MSTTDPKLAKLVKEVNLAERSFKNTLAKRKEIRKNYLSKITGQKSPRRPVGSPKTYKIPEGEAKPKTSTRKKAMQVYLGPILGTITLRGSSLPLPGADPTANFSYDKLYDKIQLDMYWRAKINYQNKQQVLIKYLRKQHGSRTKKVLNYAEVRQLLGFESESSLREARKEIATLCQKVWEIYKKVPDPKPVEIQVLLVKTIEESQFVGLNSEDSIILGEMNAELSRIASLKIDKEQQAKSLIALNKEVDKMTKKIQALITK